MWLSIKKLVCGLLQFYRHAVDLFTMYQHRIIANSKTSELLHLSSSHRVLYKSCPSLASASAGRRIELHNVYIPFGPFLLLAPKAFSSVGSEAFFLGLKRPMWCPFIPVYTLSLQDCNISPSNCCQSYKFVEATAASKVVPLISHSILRVPLDLTITTNR